MMDVLVVEDSKFFASVLRKGIEDRLGFTMVLAASRAEAKTILAEHPGRFFAALVDLHLPDSSEGEVVDDVTKNNPANVDHVLAMLRPPVS